MQLRNYGYTSLYLHCHINILLKIVSLFSTQHIFLTKSTNTRLTRSNTKENVVFSLLTVFHPLGCLWEIFPVTRSSTDVLHKHSLIVWHNVASGQASSDITTQKIFLWQHRWHDEKDSEPSGWINGDKKLSWFCFVISTTQNRKGCSKAI